MQMMPVGVSCVYLSINLLSAVSISVAVTKSFWSGLWIHQDIVLIHQLMCCGCVQVIL